MMLEFGTDHRSRTIRDLLAAVAARSGVDILLAVEGGSRGHGFASPSSDHDVRFIYRLPVVRAIALFPESESMIVKPKDLPFDPGFEVEMSGWSLAMALKLGLASNPQVSEISRLPDEPREHCAYAADPQFLQDYLTLGRMMAPRPAAHNLRGMVKRNLLKDLAPGALPKAKVYLHTAQAIMRARWIVRDPQQGHEFPLEFGQLITAAGPKGEAREQLVDLWRWKLEAADSGARRRLPVLDAWLNEEWKALERDIMTIQDAHIDQTVVEAMWLRAYAGDLAPAAEPLASVVM